MNQNLRHSGIDIIGDMPWGTHFCQFYQTKEDLLDILVPYFKAGLENNEYCMWVTSKPLDAEEAKEALRRIVTDFDVYLEKGLIEIIPYTNWYVKDGAFESERVLNGWVEKLNQALANGYDGLRLTGNTFWLEKEDWKNFVDYEKEVDRILGNYQMIALCTYSLDRCSTNEILDVVANHQFALSNREGKWEQIKSSKRKKTEETAILPTKLWEYTFDAVPDLITVIDTEYKVVRVNKAMAARLGMPPIECVGLTCYRVIHGMNEPPSFCPHRQLPEDGLEHIIEVHEDRLGGDFIESVSLLHDPRGKFIGCVYIAHDITERKKAEEALRQANENLQVQSEELQAQSEELQVQSEELQMQNEELQAQSEEIQVQNEELQAQSDELHEAYEALWESENRFRTMANAIPQLAWIARADGYIYWHNERWYDYTGTTPEQMEGWGWQSVHDPAVLPKMLEQWQASIATGQMFDMEIPLRGADGFFRPFLTRVMPQKDAKGQVLQWFGTNTDITERKQMEEALRESEACSRVAEAVEAERQRLFDVLETLPAMICLLTSDYRVAFANHEFREKFGKSSNRRCHEYCFGLTKPCEFCEAYKVLETGQPHNWEVTTPDGSVIDVNGFPFTDIDGSPMILEMNIDITERKKQKRKLKA